MLAEPPASTSVGKDPATLAAIRQIVLQHGRLSVTEVKDDDDLYRAGLTSLATVGVMLALEERFDVEFPETMLGRATFRSVEAMADAVARLANAG